MVFVWQKVLANQVTRSDLETNIKRNILSRALDNFLDDFLVVEEKKKIHVQRNYIKRYFVRRSFSCEKKPPKN